MAQWIWKFGDFETYHSLLLHDRRREYNYSMPVIWKLYQPEPVVQFVKVVTSSGGKVRVRACGNYTVDVLGESWKGSLRFDDSGEFELPEGTSKIQIRVSNPYTFPCLYVDGAVQSDESWICDDTSGTFESVGTWKQMNCVDETPERFPFAYERIFWENREEVDTGVLYDFGKETFCKVKISNLQKEKVVVRFGESRPEAMDPKWCIVRYEDIPTEENTLEYPPTAFRYVYISDPNACIEADYEYLPLDQRGSFSSGEEVVDWVWKTAAYTYHLNSREFLLDGIKRDRWVWSGDAYQSFFVNRYLYMDKELEKRTLIALGGKAPFRQHINTIMDYTFFWLISLYDFYETYGDIEFLRQIFPQAQEIMNFCLSRRSEDGFMRGKQNDWVFIDWHNIDKQGAVLGEQALFAKALETYGKILYLLGMDGEFYLKEAEKLQQQTLEKFYDAKKGVFVDSFESGRNYITRHNNILAYLYLPCTKEQKENIYKNVICNDEVEAITTPYFKFFENEVHCREGNMELLERCIREYYGAMKEHGATSLYEQFDPTQEGNQHFSMYDSPYGKSLCHAWSASPIYLLGRYRLGVENTGIAYETFRVSPKLGSLEQFEGKVPLPNGEVFVKADQKNVTVMATASGGELVLNGKVFVLQKNIPVEVGWDGEPASTPPTK